MGISAIPVSAGTVIYIAVADAAVRAALGLLAQSCGWNARALASREELLAALAQVKPACLLLDLQPSGRQGVTLLRELSRLDPGVPVIAIIAFDDDLLAARAAADGAKAVIAKPIRADELTKTISRVIAAS